MGIMSRISQAKNSFRNVQRALEGGARDQAIVEAERLGITTEQIRDKRLQEKQRYNEIYSQERLKLAETKAKQDAKAGNKLVRFAKGLQKIKARNKGKKPKNLFGGGENQTTSGSKGIDFGSGKGIDFGGSK